MCPALYKSPIRATTNRPHHGRQFSCHGLQMIRMIHWYRISRCLVADAQKSTGNDLSSCLVFGVAVGSMDYFVRAGQSHQKLLP
jgi:hypothetical protein